MSSIKKHMVLAGLITALATSAFSVVPVYADTANTAQAATQTETAQVFTIDKAIEYAKANSKTLASCKATEQYQKYYQDEARLTFKNTKKAINSVYSTGLSDINTSIVSNGFVYRSAKMSYRVAQRATILQEYTLECDVAQAFYGYLCAVNAEKYAQESLKLAQDNASYAKIRYDGGMISEFDLFDFEYAATEAQYSLNEATRNKEMSMLNLKSILNYPFDKELIVTGEFTRIPISEVSLAEALEKSKNSIARANIEEPYALAKEKLNRYHGFYSSNQAAWHSASAEFANAELTYKNSLEQQIIGIHMLYNDMIGCYEQLDLIDKSFSQVEKALKAYKMQYDMGTITAGQYISMTQEYGALKNALTAAELASYAAVVLYEATFDCVNTVFEEDDPLL